MARQTGHVLAPLPAETERHLPPFMAAEGYPVSGDRIARHMDDPSPQHPHTRRYPLGDLLWSMVEATGKGER